jgi:uracil-DNA glycosylase family 4
VDNQHPIDAAHTLLAVLQQQHDRGQTKVWLSPQDRASLKQLPALVKSYLTSELASPALPDASPEPAPPVADNRPKPEQLADVKARAEVCENCRSMGTLRDTMVFATGSPDAQLMFVGEAPGADEEKQREPFVGPAGQLLNKILKAMGIERSDVYISNIVKFRPRIDGLPDQGSKNRKPTAEEMAAAVQYVKQEIAIVQPKVIVALGGTAMEGLLGIEGAVSRMRSHFHDLHGRPVMVTYHPSYLLRNEDVSEKRKLWEDMLMVMERLGMEISDKQRGFFKKG